MCQIKDWYRHSDECATMVGVNIPVSSKSCMRPGVQWGENRSRLLSSSQFGVLQNKRRIGGGSYGTVSDIPISLTDLAVVKQMSIYKEGIRIDVLHEMELRNINHPNITGICAAGYVSPETEFPRGSFVIVSDKAHYSLSDLIKDRLREKKKLPRNMLQYEKETKFLAYQLILGLAHLHEKLIVHLDVKPDNVLVYGESIDVNRDVAHELGENISIKRLAWTDFGLSLGLCIQGTEAVVQHTQWYRPPEVCMGSKLATFAGDVWATGCVLYELITGKVLFGGEPDGSRNASTKQFDMYVGMFGLGAFMQPTQSRVNWFPNLTPTYQPILQPSTTYDMFVRELDRHPGSRSLLLRMLNPDPERRCTLAEALADPYFFDIQDRIIVPFYGSLGSSHLAMALYSNPSMEINADNAYAMFIAREMTYWNKTMDDALDPRFFRVSSMIDDATKIFAGLMSLTSQLKLKLRTCAIVRKFIQSGIFAVVNVDEDLCLKIVITAFNLAHAYYNHNYTSDYHPVDISLMDNSYNTRVAEYAEMQKKMLTVLDFDVTFPCAYEFGRLMFGERPMILISSSPRPAQEAWKMLSNIFVGEFEISHHQLRDLVKRFKMSGIARLCLSVYMFGSQWTFPIPPISMTPEEHNQMMQLNQILGSYKWSR